MNAEGEPTTHEEWLAYATETHRLLNENVEMLNSWKWWLPWNAIKCSRQFRVIRRRVEVASRTVSVVR